MTEAGLIHFAVRGKGKGKGKNACGASVGLATNNHISVTCSKCLTKLGIKKVKLYHAAQAHYENGLAMTWCGQPVPGEEIAQGMQQANCNDCAQSMAHACKETRPTPSITAPPAAPEAKSRPQADSVPTECVSAAHVHCVDGGFLLCTGYRPKLHGLSAANYITKGIGDPKLVNCEACRKLMYGAAEEASLEDVVLSGTSHFFKKVTEEYEKPAPPAIGISGMFGTANIVVTCARCEAIAKLLASFGVPCP